MAGAFRHVLSDEDSEFDKQLLRIERAMAPTVAVKPVTIAPTNVGSVAIIVPVAEKFSCVCDGEVIGTSKHKDYWEYHYARGDLKAAQTHNIGKFVRLLADGSIECVASAKHLKERGVKGSMISPSMLSANELALLTEAFSLSAQS